AHDPHHDAAHHGPAAAHDDDAGHHDHEPSIMIVPLVVLAIGAVLAGCLNVPERVKSLGGFLGQSPSVAQSYDVVMRQDASQIHPLAFGQFKDQEDLETHDKPFVEAEHALHWRVMAASFLVFFVGIYFAYLLHLRDRTAG